MTAMTAKELKAAVDVIANQHGLMVDPGEFCIVSVPVEKPISVLTEFLVDLQGCGYTFRPYDDFDGKMAVKSLKHGELRIVVEPRE